MPQTVCADCAKNDRGVPIYEKSCHDPCYLDNVTENLIGHWALENCYAFHWGNRTSCRECGHSWRRHLHTCYTAEKYTEQKLDSGVQALLNTKNGEKAAAQRQIDILDVELRQYEREMKTIEDKIMALVSYIKSAACLPYSDPRERYLLDLHEDAMRKNVSAHELRYFQKVCSIPVLLKYCRDLSPQVRKKFWILKPKLKSHYDVPFLSFIPV